MRERWIYLIEQRDHNLLQIGISNNPAQRLRDHGSRGWTVLDIRGPMAGDLAQSIERQILAELRLRGIRLGDIGGRTNFSGYTKSWLASTCRVSKVKDLPCLMEDE